jgi:hypothetical protein
MNTNGGLVFAFRRPVVAFLLSNLKREANKLEDVESTLVAMALLVMTWADMPVES